MTTSPNFSANHYASRSGLPACLDMLSTPLQSVQSALTTQANLQKDISSLKAPSITNQENFQRAEDLVSSLWQSIKSQFSHLPELFSIFNYEKDVDFSFEKFANTSSAKASQVYEAIKTHSEPYIASITGKVETSTTATFDGLKQSSSAIYNDLKARAEDAVGLVGSIFNRQKLEEMSTSARQAATNYANSMIEFTSSTTQQAKLAFQPISNSASNLQGRISTLMSEIDPSTIENAVALTLGASALLLIGKVTYKLIHSNRRTVYENLCPGTNRQKIITWVNEAPSNGLIGKIARLTVPVLALSASIVGIPLACSLVMEFVHQRRFDALAALALDNPDATAKDLDKIPQGGLFFSAPISISRKGGKDYVVINLIDRSSILSKRITLEVSLRAIQYGYVSVDALKLATASKGSTRHLYHFKNAFGTSLNTTSTCLDSSSAPSLLPTIPGANTYRYQRYTRPVIFTTPTLTYPRPYNPWFHPRPYYSPWSFNPFYQPVNTPWVPLRPSFHYTNYTDRRPAAGTRHIVSQPSSSVFSPRYAPLIRTAIGYGGTRRRNESSRKSSSTGTTPMLRLGTRAIVGGDIRTATGFAKTTRR